MQWIDYRQSLGIGFSNFEKTRMLTNKIIVMFDSISELHIAAEESICRRYFRDVGERNDGAYYSWYQVKANVTKQNDIPGLIAYSIAFSNACNKEHEQSLGKEVLTYLQTFLTELNLDFELIKDNNECFIFPKGAKELDVANVSIPFEWLRSYPLARKAMENALRAYSNKELPSQVADLFRKALETFAKEFFGNDVSLENQKSNIGRFLKDRGVPKELSGTFENTLQMYTNYMNNYAKHNDKTSENFLEFIMYQTGNIIRFVISVSNQKN